MVPMLMADQSKAKTDANAVCASTHYMLHQVGTGLQKMHV